MEAVRAHLGRGIGHTQGPVCGSAPDGAWVGELPEDRAAVTLHRLGSAPVSRYAGVRGGVDGVGAGGLMDSRRLGDDQPCTTLCPCLVIGDEAVVGHLVGPEEHGLVAG